MRDECEMENIYFINISGDVVLLHSVHYIVVVFNCQKYECHSIAKKNIYTLWVPL